jgi:WD40 repeat protein
MTITPFQITPSSDRILQANLSPNGLYVAAMTVNSQGDTAIEVWKTTEPSDHIRLMPELTMFDGFLWSPNSQYIAVTSRRGNASGNEYVVLIYDILDESYAGQGFAAPHCLLGEFVTSGGTGPFPDYVPMWSTNSYTIAINFRDGIHFYDITDWEAGECPLLHVLEVGYVSWFEWQGNTLLTLSDNTVQLWNTNDFLH